MLRSNQTCALIGMRGRGGVYMLREREDVYTGGVDCMYMEGLECTMHGDRMCIYGRGGV